MFQPRCGSQAVVVVARASYGRMRVNKCMSEDLGYLGCSRDVLAYLDDQCSGRHQCDVSIKGSSFKGLEPCHNDIKSYLNVTYKCIPGGYEETFFRYFKFSIYFLDWPFL